MVTYYFYREHYKPERDKAETYRRLLNDLTNEHKIKCELLESEKQLTKGLQQGLSELREELNKVYTNLTAAKHDSRINYENYLALAQKNMNVEKEKAELCAELITARKDLVSKAEELLAQAEKIENLEATVSANNEELSKRTAQLEANQLAATLRRNKISQAIIQVEHALDEVMDCETCRKHDCGDECDCDCHEAELDKDHIEEVLLQVQRRLREI